MSDSENTITDKLKAFIEAQHVFFVATAPSGEGGHVNLSPKGMDTFRVLGSTTVAYLDVTGSGNETAAHVAQNGRLTIMFCAFDGKPTILRVQGRGRLVMTNSPEFDAMIGHFPAIPGTRQIIVCEATRVKTSCGFGVPLMDYVGEREEFDKWAGSKGEEGMREYRDRKNRVSIDGIPIPTGDPQS